MTPAQEQAASAARRACIEWLKSYPGPTPPSQAADAAWRKWSQDLPYAHEIKNAFLAAWRAQWEIR